MNANKDALLGYLTYLENERRSSPHTLSSYARDIQHLFDFAGNTPLADLSGQHIRRRFAATQQGVGG